VPNVEKLLATLFLASGATAAANNADNVNNTQSDLTASGTYSGGSPTTNSDVTFLGNTTYSPTTFTLNTSAFNLNIGTLDDLDTTQTLTINNTSGTADTSTITLSGGSNSVAPSASDLLYVASLGTLSIGTANGTGDTLNLALAASGNFDIAGTATIGSVISGSGFGLTKTGNGTLILANSDTFTAGVTLSAGTLGISSGLAVGPTPGSLTTQLTFAGNSTLQFQAGIPAGSALNINRSFLIDSGVTATVDTQGYIDYADNQWTGSGNLVKIGTGTLVLEGNNDSYTGSTTISAGALEITGSGGALGTASGQTSGVTVASGAALQLTGSISTTEAVALTLNGTGVAASPNGALESISGNNTYSGLIALGSAATIGSDAGSLALSNTGNITGAAGLTLTGSGNGSIAAIIGTSGGLTKNGTGTWVLTGASTYTSGTTVSAGVLQVGNATALGGNTSAVSVTAGAALDLKGTTMTGTNALTLNGTGISSGGALINSSATAGTYAGLVTLGSSGVSIGGTGSITLSNTGAITGSGYNLTLIGAGGSINSVIGTGGGNVTVNSTGTWNLSGSTGAGGNTFTGGVLLDAGTLAINSGTNLGPVPVSPTTMLTFAGNGTLQFTGPIASTAPLSPNRSFVINNGVTGTVDTQGYSVYTSNVWSGSGSLTKIGNGTLFLDASNTYMGGTTISAGTLRANNGSATGAGNITAAATSSGNYTGGMLGGSGNVSGTVTLAGSATARLGGIIGAGADSSTVGTLTTGNQTWNGGAAYEWKISNAGTNAAFGTGNSTSGSWDNVKMSGLSIASGGGNQPFSIALNSLSSPSGSGTYSWVIAQTTSAPTGLSGNAATLGADLLNLTPTGSTATGSSGSYAVFALDTSGFGNGFSLSGADSNNFSLEFISVTGGEDLVLDYNSAPEPGAAVLASLGAVPLLGARRRRRRSTPAER